MMRYKSVDKKLIDPITPPCRKKIYDTPEDAEDMIRHIKETRVVRDIKAYKCTICGFWHLTSRS